MSFGNVAGPTVGLNPIGITNIHQDTYRSSQTHNQRTIYDSDTLRYYHMTDTTI